MIPNATTIPFVALVPKVQSALAPPDSEAESAAARPRLGPLAALTPLLLALPHLLFFLLPEDLIVAVVCLMGLLCRPSMAGRLRMPSLEEKLFTAPGDPSGSAQPQNHDTSAVCTV